jgi:hypothetical protein
MTNLDLEKQIEKINKKHQTSERKEVFQYLNKQLENLELEGEVSSILVYDTFRGKINCYGKYLSPASIQSKLNLTIGTNGSNLTGHVAYPNLNSLSSYQNGYFIPMDTFNPNNSSNYVALINIDINFSETLEDIVKFP